MTSKDIVEHLKASHLGSASHQAALAQHHEKLAAYHLATSPALAKLHEEAASLCKGRSRYHERALAELGDGESSGFEDVSSSSSSSATSTSKSVKDSLVKELVGS